MPHRTDRALARGPPRRDAANPEFPHHHHCAGGTARYAARQPARRLRHADEGRGRGHHRTRPRSPPCRWPPSACFAILHTWTQQLVYHPHVHCLVTGGGISDDGASWHPARNAFLVPVKALAKLVRGKLRAALATCRPDLVLPEAAWSKPWVVHCTVWGCGEQAVLDYLARYVFRVAITNARIVAIDDQSVTIRHKHRKSNRWRTSRIPGPEFMRRFLQHVLPKGLHKVRYFGLWHPSKREHVARARLLCCSCSAHPATPRQGRDACGRHKSGHRRGSVHRIADLPLLQRRAVDACPPSFPQAGRRTMTSRDPPLRPRPGPTACAAGMPSASLALRTTMRDAGMSRAPKFPANETVPVVPAWSRRRGQRHPDTKTQLGHQAIRAPTCEPSPQNSISSTQPRAGSVQQSFCIGSAMQKLLIRSCALARASPSNGRAPGRPSL